MKIAKKFFVFGVIVSMFLSSCTMQKCVYSKGYYVDWFGNKSKGAVTKQALAEQSTFISVSEAVNQQEFAARISEVDAVNDNSEMDFLMASNEESIILTQSSRLVPTNKWSAAKPFLSPVPKHRGSGNRTFGVGVNYTFPAMGFSAKAALSEKFKVQGNYSRRTYGVTGFKYSWTMYGIEGEYCFEESSLNKGAVIPFVFAGLGRGVMDYGDLFGDDLNFGWWSYSVGGALEFFPSFLNNNFGITTRLGYGSMGFGGGSIGNGISVSGVFMYGFGFHYYLK